MAAPANCNDRANVIAVQASYAYHDPANLPAHGPCLGPPIFRRTRCQDTSQVNHRNAAGVAPAQFMVCHTCEQHGINIVNQRRRSAAAAANSPFSIRARNQLLTGIGGAHTRGRLCDPCIDLEIAAYYRRRFVDGQTAQKASSTCKCQKELAKRVCIKDRVKRVTKIQADTDRNAGPGGWLQHLDLDVNGRATYARTPAAVAALLLRRRTQVVPQRILNNACRCGGDVPHPGNAQLLNAPVPVAACTACSGVTVVPLHNRVINFVHLWQRPAGPALLNPPNLDYGRHIP